MKRRTLFSVVLALAVGLGACGDDDDGGSNNSQNNHHTMDAGDTGLDGSRGDGGNDLVDGGPDGGNTDGGGDTDAVGDATAGSSAISADDQLVEAANSNKVTVASATSDGPGFVVIHEGDGEGNVGEIIGQTAIEDGSSNDVSVEVDRNLTHGETLYAMLHTDSGTVGSYDPADDTPVTDDDGTNIVDTFEVGVPTVVAYDPTTVDDLSTVITLNTVTSTGAGFVVIHENACDDFGDVIGHAGVDRGENGENNDVEVTLDRPAVDGESLCGMLHTDTGETGAYEFDGSAGSEDAPVTLADDSIVMQTFSPTVTDGIPAVRMTLSSSGTQNYLVDSVEPANYDNGLSDVTDDPDFTFREGWRYEIVNTVSGAHPFEFLASSIGLGSQVKLSQASDPNAENQGQPVNWQENGDSIVFTIAGPFTSPVNSIDSYRCNVHKQSMTGDVTVMSP